MYSYFSEYTFRLTNILKLAAVAVKKRRGSESEDGRCVVERTADELIKQKKMTDGWICFPASSREGLFTNFVSV